MGEMRERTICTMFILIVYEIGLSKARSTTNIYYDLKTEIQQLHTKILQLEQLTAHQEAKIEKLTKLVSNLSITATNETGKHSITKRSPFQGRRWRRSPEVGFLVALYQSTLAVEKDDVIKFDAVMTNIGNAYDTKTGKFECKTPGTYIFNLNLLAGKRSYLEASIKQNGISKVTAVSDHREGKTEYDQGSAVAILIVKKRGYHYRCYGLAI